MVCKHAHLTYYVSLHAVHCVYYVYDPLFARALHIITDRPFSEFPWSRVYAIAPLILSL